MSQNKRWPGILFIMILCLFTACGSSGDGDDTKPGPTSTQADTGQTPGTGDDTAEAPGSAVCEAGDPEASSQIYSHQVYRAFSADAYTFQPENVLLLDHASVPDGVIGPDGRVRVYFINAEPGKHGIFYAEESSDGTWEVKNCVKIDGEFNGNAVDPDIVRLPDGRFRLFYFQGYFTTPPPAEEGPHPIFSAISEDGEHFTVENQLIAVDGVTDPSAVRLPDGTWLLALLQGGMHRTLLASSTDGVQFELTGTTFDVDGIPELALLPDGRVRLFLNKSFVSDDNGKTWTQEPERFIPGPDPSLVALPDGTYVMFYKKFATDQPGPDNPSDGQSSGDGAEIPVSIPVQQTDLGFSPDSGIRIDNANLPNVGIDPDTGSVYLYGSYSQTHPENPGKSFRAVAADGLNFDSIEIIDGPQDQVDYSFDSRNIRLPDGTYRRYQYRDGDTVVTSLFSSDGKYFRPEEGIRYTLREEDQGWMGVRTIYSTPDNRVVMIYLADKLGLNNARMAVSDDNGQTFTFEKGDVFGDSALGGAQNSFVDPAKVFMPDGRLRIVTMRQGKIYTFISTEETLTSFAFEGLQLTPDDFTEFNATTFFDPKALVLSDGTVRVYTVVQIIDESGTGRQAIVSATSSRSFD